MQRLSQEGLQLLGTDRDDLHGYEDAASRLVQSRLSHPVEQEGYFGFTGLPHDGADAWRGLPDVLVHVPSAPRGHEKRGMAASRYCRDRRSLLRRQERQPAFGQALR